MNTIATYLLKCILTSGLLTGWYWICLRNRKIHGYNRFFLLFTMTVSLAIPLFNFSYFTIAKPENNVISGLLSNILVYEQDHQVFLYSWQLPAAVGCVLISTVLLLLLFRRIVHIYQLKRSHFVKKMDGFNLVETQLAEAPFCFLDCLFWRTDISPDGENGRKIYMHELTHIRERHTYDKLFSQFIVCIFWMNPFYWLLQRELNMIHEFIADDRSIVKGDTESFALMLLQSYNKGKYLDPAHSFYHSPIKRRLLMVANIQRPGYALLRKISLLPVLLIVVSMFSFTVNDTAVPPYTADALSLNEKLHDKKVRAEKEYLEARRYDKQFLTSNNNISQASLHPAPFLNLTSGK